MLCMKALIIHQRNSAPFIFSKWKLGQKLWIEPKQSPTIVTIIACSTVLLAMNEICLSDSSYCQHWYLKWLMIINDALMPQVMQCLHPSVCPSVRPYVSILSLESTDCWPWTFANEYVMIIARRGLKIKVIRQGQGRGSGQRGRSDLHRGQLFAVERRA